MVLILAFCISPQVALAQSCSTGSHGLQERAAGALWGLSVSEANRWDPVSYNAVACNLV